METFCSNTVTMHLLLCFLGQQKQYVRKTLAICATLLAGCLLLKKVKYFEVMLKIFEFWRM